MSGTTILTEMLSTDADVGFNPNPTRSIDVNGAISDMNNADTVDEIRAAVSNVITAIQMSFDRFIEDQRTLHNNSVATVADEQTATEQSNNVTTNEIVDGVRSVTTPILEEAREARQALGDGILGRISDKVTSFTGSLKPILPSLQTFGIAFATTGLGAMFMTNALISAIKFIFNNPLMFIGSLIGGSILYNMFKQPIDDFITKITSKLKGWLSGVLASALTKTIADSAKTIEGIIDKFFNRFDSSTTIFFNRADTTIEKLEKAITGSWDRIFIDIDSMINTIFNYRVPEAITLFFDTFNNKIPTIINTIITELDSQLQKSNEYSKIISTVDGATNALNSFQTFYNSNKERFDKLINIASKGFDVLDRSAGAVKGAYNTISRFIPDSWKSDKKPTTTNESTKSDNSIPKTEPTRIKPLPIVQPTNVSNNKVATASQPSTTIVSKTVGNALGKGLVFTAQAVKEEIKSNYQSEFNELGEKTKKTINEGLGPVKDKLDKVNNELSETKKQLVEAKDEIHSSISLIKFALPYLINKQPPVVVNGNNKNDNDSSKRPDSKLEVIEGL